MANILITGADSGLGLSMLVALRRSGHTVHTFNLGDGRDVRKPYPSDLPTDIDVLINNAGINRINYLEDFEEQEWDDVMDTNAKGIYMMTRACLPSLIARKGTVLNIVSNAAHMPMTGSLAYNASKGAAHIMTLQLARELSRRWGITVFGIAPNRLKGTGMSRDIDEQVVKTRGWTPEYARQYQLGALLAGEETSPEALADFVAYLLLNKERHRFLTGTVLPYGA
jgi:NAD(P)-dependent dehydrogenase (short-subunit alcohol dehydrogenase family)